MKQLFIAGCFVAAGLCSAAAFCAGLGTTLDRVRFPAELLIVQGDLQRLIFLDHLSPDERLGLEGRIGSALGGIEWLALEYEALTKSTVSRDALQRLQESWLTRDLASALERVSGLARNHSLNVEIFSPDRATLDDVGRVQEIDAQLCQGCHIDSVGAAKILPAYRLQDMTRVISGKEFLARLLSGVRGTAETSLANPLSLGDIRGFMKLYRAAAD
ncbi:MAG: hypothetical protein ACJ0TD_01995 [Arenicellales bacterium]